jgi:hypothetical protein
MPMLGSLRVLKPTLAAEDASTPDVAGPKSVKQSRKEGNDRESKCSELPLWA